MKFILLLTLFFFNFYSSYVLADMAPVPGTGIGQCTTCNLYHNYSNAPYYGQYTQFCATCSAYYQNQNTTPMFNPYANPYFQSSLSFGYTPWWANQMPQMNMWNMWSPGPYNGWGIQPQALPNYYPQTQNCIPSAAGTALRIGGPSPCGATNDIVLDKPVVYVSAPDQTQVTVHLKFTGPGILTATVPAYPDSGWKAKVVNNKFVTEEGTYDFLFYDGRFPDQALQDQSGTCGTRTEILSYMTDGLSKRGFQRNEIQDFSAHWSAKLPWNQELCVFPQSEKEISPFLKVEIEPSSARFTQLEFIVVPENYFKFANTKSRPKFAKAPDHDFNFVAPARVPASKSDVVQVRDWGVGFMVIDHPFEPSPVKGQNEKEKL